MEPNTVSSAEEPTDSGAHPNGPREWECPQVPPLSVMGGMEIEPEQYMECRAVYKIKTYEKLAKQHKHWYLFSSGVALLGSVIVPVLINLGEQYQLPVDHVVLTTIISLLVTISVSIEKLLQFREHWRSFAAVAADLHYEQLQFQAGAGEYSEEALKKDKAKGVDAFQKFVIRFEGRINQEKGARIEWETEQNTQNA
jgi:hypothetical protein